MTEPVIQLQNVVCRFGDFVAVENLSFTVERGEIIALVGKTGAGKSTAINLVMGSIKPTAGKVAVEGIDPFGEAAALRGKIGASFQTDRLLPWRTAIENVQLGMQILRFAREDIEQRAKEWLARVKMEEAGSKYPHELSGGMRQRVSLARALAVDPSILLLDESFSQLDQVTSVALRRDVSELVRSLKKTCLFITHRIDDAIEMADRIIVLTSPARISLERKLDAAARAQPDALKAQIANAMV